MDEHEDVSVDNNDDSESTVRVSADGDDAIPIGNMDFKGLVDGGELAVDEVGGACHNGEDIMVEVMGSDVFVDGVCGSGGGGNSDEEDEDEDEVEVGGVDNLASIEVGVLAGGSETDIKGSLVTEQVLDGQIKVFVAATECTQPQVVQEEEAVAEEKKEDLEGGLGEGGERGREVVEVGGVVNADTGLHKDEITDDDVLNPRNETGVRESSKVVITTHQETCVVVESVEILANEMGTDGELVQQDVGKHVDSVDDVVCVLDEKMTQEAGVLDNELGKPGTEAEIVSCSGIVVESSSVENQVEESLNPKDEAPNVDASKGIISDHVKDQNSMAEKAAGKIEDSIATSVEMESSYEQTQVVDNEVAEMHNKEADPKHEVLEIDSLNENPACSDNNKNIQIETASKETVGNVVHADSEAPGEHIDRGEVAADVKEALNEVEVPQSNDLDGKFCSSEDQEVKADMKSSMEGTQIADTCDIAAVDISNLGSDVEQEREANDHMIDGEQKGLDGGQTVEAEEMGTDAEQPKTIEEEKFARRATLKSGSSIRVPQATYQLPTENEAEFSVSDLVWGKVRSHPWWPGQIFDPSDSSEKAMKYHKKDCYLVAYFGDRTFAWNEASLLKHFRTHFSLIEKQSNSEAFHSAVNCALEEISRRVELGLACSCIAKDTYEKIKYQIVENTGIRQESNRRNGVDKSASANTFEPDKFVEYVKELAQLPSGGADQLDLVIAKAQLLSLYRLKGYHNLPEFQYFEGLVENDVDIYFPEDKKHSSQVIEHGNPICENGEQLSTEEEKLKIQNSSFHKRKHNLKESMYPRKKEKNISELMDGTTDSPDDEYGCDGKNTEELASTSTAKKRRAEESFDDDFLVQDKRKGTFSAHVANNVSPSLRQSFKIGECISRVASQLTGSPSTRKCNGEIFQKVDLGNNRSAGTGFDVSAQTPEDSHRRKMVIPTDYSTPDEMLPQLHLVAQDPMKGYSFLNIIVNFFSDFRNSVIPGQYSRRGNMSVDKVGSGRKKKSSRSLIGSPETFEFEDMKDSYWTDRVIQNGSEEQPSRRNKRDYQLVAFEPEDPLQVSHRVYSRKKSNNGNHKLAGARTMSSVDERKPDLSPTELVMSFPQADSVPSETNLNRMFRRFGPLKESETEVDRKTSRARVIFKRCSDAEVAFSSAGKFNIFGPMLVTYELNYSPSLHFIAPSIAATQDLEAAIAQDMELAATEYLEEATTQYLEDVSIQYLEDGTTQYLEDASTPYLEDVSMQYLEVEMTQNLEHARAENVEDASPHNLEVSTTQYLQDAMAQSLIDPGAQNVEGAQAQSQNLGGAAEQNVEDVAAQNLELPHLEGATANNVEDAMANVEGAIMQNVEGSTMQNLEVAETQNIAGTQNLDDETSYHMEDATAQHMVDAMAQGMEDATTQGMEDAAVEDIEDAAVEDIEDAAAEDIEDAAVEDIEDAAAQDMEDAAAQDIEDATSYHMEDTMAQHMEDATTQGMEDATTQGMVDATSYHMEDTTVQHMEDAAAQDMEDVTAHYTEDATAQHVENAMTHNMEDAAIQNMEDPVTQNMEDATTQHMEDETS